MQLSLYDRYVAAYNQKDFQGQVMGALVKHSKYVIRTMLPATTNYDNMLRLAKGILANPSTYVGPFGFSLLLEPIFDSMTDAVTLTDVQVGTNIVAIFELYAKVY